MANTPPPQSSALRLPSPLSEMEAKFYYTGLPSAPVLVARTGTTPWKMPTDLEAEAKELRPSVGDHPLREAWEGDLPRKVIAVLDSMEVKWTGIDIVRIGNEEEYLTRSAPVIVWIGVMPESLSGNDGLVAASKCRELLVEYDITDVDVEIRESVVTYWGTYAALDEIQQSNSKKLARR